MMTQRPGFADPVHGAQKSFRGLLNALSHPGTAEPLFTELTPPTGLTPACGAACLTLLDLETSLWLSPHFSSDVKAWLQFHTGCQLTEDPQIANFAVIPEISFKPHLNEFNRGTPEQPEQSTTVLIQLQTFVGGESMILQGPGIQNKQTVHLPVPDSFWQEWQRNTQCYPLGIDIFFLSQNAVMGLPRTTQSIDV